MAEVKISQLVLFNPDLLDEVIVNDVSGLITKRSTLQSIRDLANQNIDDTLTGSKITGDLEITGALTDGVCTIPDICEIVTQTELEELLGIDPETGLVASLMCARDSAPTLGGGDCGLRILGETTIDSDLYVKGNVYITGDGTNNLQWDGKATGDGEFITNIQFALKSDSADHARYATNAGYATFADSATIADSADHSRFSLFSRYSKEQQNVQATTDANHYLLMSQAFDAIDSVEADGQLFYNPTTDILDAGFFRGDGSLLTNVVADNVRANELNTVTTTSIDNHYIIFREAATGFDSANTDDALQYNPAGNYITGGTHLDGWARFAKNTEASNATGVVNYIMMRADATGEDSVNTHSGVTYNATSETLSASNFSGNGSALTLVDAVTATTATNVIVSAITDGATYYPMYSPGTSGGQPVKVSTALAINPSSGAVAVPSDTGKLTFGADSDTAIFHDGSNAFIDTQTGGLNIINSAGATNVVIINNLPTVDSDLVVGQLWNNAGSLQVSAGPVLSYEAVYAGPTDAPYSTGYTGTASANYTGEFARTQAISYVSSYVSEPLGTNYTGTFLGADSATYSAYTTQYSALYEALYEGNYQPAQSYDGTVYAAEYAGVIAETYTAATTATYDTTYTGSIYLSNYTANYNA